MTGSSWQSQTLVQLAGALAADPAVRESWVYGSGVSGDFDVWSDLDVAVVAAGDEVVRLASPSWLSVLGPVWTYQTFARDRGSGVRVVYRDGRLLDLIAVTDRAAIPPERRRLEGGDAVPGGNAEPAGIPDIPSVVHDFRFTAALAVVKNARDDRLIGGHLALDLPRQCLVAAMLLRDRAAGTTHHRVGGPLNSVLDKVFELIPDETGPDAILDLVDASAGLFDDLAGKLWPGYAADWSGLTVLLDRARARVP